MKRAIAISFILIIMAAGCSNATGSTGNENKLSIVCTIFPAYDWAAQILGSEANVADVTLIQNNGVDLHSFQPSVEDIIKISSCDLFIYVGGESDMWVTDALKEAVNKDMAVINLLEVLGGSAVIEENPEGSQEPHEGEGGGYDEHVWLSLKNSEKFCGAIAEGLKALNPDNAPAYQTNLEAYVAKLKGLDTKYQNAVDSASQKTLLFGDRFPFQYLINDYGLDYYAAFPGCSAESEASFETIMSLANKVDELGLNKVMVTEGSDKSIANTIINNTKSKPQEILTMDSLQSVTPENIQNGASYLSIMESNLGVLIEAIQ